MRKKLVALILVVCSFFGIVEAQQNVKSIAKPKLIVGIVVDQMRWDYLVRFNPLFGPAGFNRLIRQGFSFNNTFIPYTPTYTAPGHASIYTGSIPAINGIVGNYWYDKRIKRVVYCTEDSSVSSVGTSSWAGRMSPVNMWTTSITDELRLSNNFSSKVIGIALKDRGVIFPAGHTANAAYWFDPSIGKWISSSFYMKDLPVYVTEFNNLDLPGKYMTKDWKTLLPIEQYKASDEDDQRYETPLPGLSSTVFPHRLTTIGKEKYEAFSYTPSAATFTFDFAKNVVENEKLGQHKFPDFLALSISSTDFAGHYFGPNSIEVQDIYTRLDRDIAAFLEFLDVKVGKGEYLVFLTADHGVANTTDFLKDHKIPAGTFSNIPIQEELNAMAKEKFSIDKLIPSVQNFQVYVDKDRIAAEKKDESAVFNEIRRLLEQKSFIAQVIGTQHLPGEAISEPQRTRMLNGFNTQRSGDLQFILRPGYSDRIGKGTTHGSWNPYDAHIPLLFYGWGISEGNSSREVYMTDIAPTLAALLHIQMPSGSIGKVLTEIVK